MILFIITIFFTSFYFFYMKGSSGNTKSSLLHLAEILVSFLHLQTCSSSFTVIKQIQIFSLTNAKEY